MTSLHAALDHQRRLRARRRGLLGRIIDRLSGRGGGPWPAHADLVNEMGHWRAPSALGANRQRTTDQWLCGPSPLPLAGHACPVCAMRARRLTETVLRVASTADDDPTMLVNGRTASRRNVGWVVQGRPVANDCADINRGSTGRRIGWMPPEARTVRPAPGDRVADHPAWATVVLATVRQRGDRHLEWAATTGAVLDAAGEPRYVTTGPPGGNGRLCPEQPQAEPMEWHGWGCGRCAQIAAHQIAGDDVPNREIAAWGIRAGLEVLDRDGHTVGVLAAGAVLDGWGPDTVDIATATRIETGVHPDDVDYRTLPGPGGTHVGINRYCTADEDGTSVVVTHHDPVPLCGPDRLGGTDDGVCLACAERVAAEAGLRLATGIRVRLDGRPIGTDADTVSVLVAIAAATAMPGTG